MFCKKYFLIKFANLIEKHRVYFSKKSRRFTFNFEKFLERSFHKILENDCFYTTQELNQCYTCNTTNACNTKINVILPTVQK